MYQLIKRDGKAKRGRFTTVHGVIETPVFMNVGTAAAIKGAVSTMDLQEIGTQVELSNTYHLHVRPGDEVVFFGYDRFGNCLPSQEVALLIGGDEGCGLTAALSPRVVRAYSS